MSRSKGTPNRITSKTNALLSDVIGTEADRIWEALDEVFEYNQKDYLQIMVRLIPFVMPRATEVESAEAKSGRKTLSWFTETSLYSGTNQITS